MAPDNQAILLNLYIYTADWLSIRMYKLLGIFLNAGNQYSLSLYFILYASEIWGAITTGKNIIYHWIMQSARPDISCRAPNICWEISPNFAVFAELGRRPFYLDTVNLRKCFIFGTFSETLIHVWLLNMIY